MPILLGRQVIGHLGWSVIACKAKQRQAIVARVCVCVARNRDNRAIMAEGGLSKSSKYSSAGILGIGSSRRQQILPATILGEIQSRVVGKMQIDNLGFFTAATAPYLYFCRIIDFQIFFYQIIKWSSKPIHDMRLS